MDSRVYEKAADKGAVSRAVPQRNGPAYSSPSGADEVPTGVSFGTPIFNGVQSQSLRTGPVAQQESACMISGNGRTIERVRALLNVFF